MKVNLTMPLPNINPPNRQIQSSNGPDSTQVEQAGFAVRIEKRKLEKSPAGMSQSDIGASDHKRPRMDTSVMTLGVTGNETCNKTVQKSLRSNAKKNSKFHGPSDIVTAKGTNKIAIFVAKQEKVEPVHGECEPEITVLVLDDNNSDTLQQDSESGYCQTQRISEKAETHTVVAPMDQVLTCPKLLQRILEHLRNDIKTLLRVRLVNSSWKKCAYFAFLQNLTLLPTIVVGKMRADNDGELIEPEEWSNFQNSVKPSSGFPLSFHITSCTKRGMSFMKPYAGDIAHLKLDCTHLEEFCIETHVVPLTALETAFFCGTTDVSQSLPKCSKLFLVWKALIGEGTYLKCYNEKWNNLFWSHSFGWPNGSFLDKIIESQDLPQLRNVSLVYTARQTRQTFQSPFLLTKGDNLTVLTLGANHNFILGPMKNLKVLNLLRGASFTGSEPLSQLLPNLVKVSAMDPLAHIRTEESEAMVILTESNSVVGKVVEMDILELDNIQDWKSCKGTLQKFTTKAVACFANLTKLQWTSMKSYTQMAACVHIVFANLEHLNGLKLEFRGGGIIGLVKLLTAILPKEIPQDRDKWPSLLEGRHDAVCNLRKLKSLKLGNSGFMKEVAVPEFISQFLFDAAFKKLATLDRITIERFRFAFVTGGEMDGAKEWRQSGRMLVYE